MVDQGDVQDWVKRFNDGLADTKTITAPAGHDAIPWHESLFGCLNPIDTCTFISSRREWQAHENPTLNRSGAD